MANDKLSALVQALPAELYDELLELTFTASTEPRALDDNYRPPKFLQVNRATREIFAKTYYGNSFTFYISKALVNKWALSLSKHHLDIITDIKIHDARAYFDPILGMMYRVRVEDWDNEADNQLRKNLKNLSGGMKANVLKIKHMTGDLEGVWISSNKVVIPYR